MVKEDTSIVLSERIANRIFVIRGKRVMLDRDLAELYGVETRALNQAVQRNVERFPEDFMFRLTKEETEIWKSQIVISNRERMGLRKPPLAFTDYGVLMLSSVLRSQRAIQVNIQIVRTFAKLRDMLSTHTKLRRKIEDMEQHYDKQFKVVFEALKQLLDKPDPPPHPPYRIGFGVE